MNQNRPGTIREFFPTLRYESEPFNHRRSIHPWEEGKDFRRFFEPTSDSENHLNRNPF